MTRLGEQLALSSGARMCARRQVGSRARRHSAANTASAPSSPVRTAGPTTLLIATVLDVAAQLCFDVVEEPPCDGDGMEAVEEAVDAAGGDAPLAPAKQQPAHA